MKIGAYQYFQKIERAITCFLYYTGFPLRSLGEPFAVILAYHDICNLPKEVVSLHPYNVSPSSFREQMEFLHKKNYSVTRLEDLISCLRNNKKIPRKSVVITFDDGYENNYKNALPLLREFNFPATIFLTTNYIGSNEPFPWLNSICESDLRVRENWMPLSWEEVMKMSRDNITFGSHTCSHSNFRLMNENSVESEIVNSTNIIEEKLNKKVNLFSYPFSLPKHRSRYKSLVDITRNILIVNGFLGACTTLIGINSRKTDPFFLRRIQIKNSDTISQFNAKIEGAYNWAGLAQKIYQKCFEPVIEKRYQRNNK